MTAGPAIPDRSDRRRADLRALERRPDARSYSIEKLLELVEDGRVRIPPFQRDLKWDVDDAVALLDSVYKGYPIGTLLFWQRSAKAGPLAYGSVVIQGKETTDALWVVDGQQRITSLVRVLLGSGHPQEEFALFFDIEHERFIHPRRKEATLPHHVPLTEVLDSERLITWLLDHGRDLDRAPVIALGKRIREYQVPAYIVSTEDERAVREIFKRLNSTGKRMEDAEVFNALYGAHEDSQPSDLREVGRSLQSLGFGRIDDETLHTMMLATLSTDVTKNRVPDLSAADATRAMSELERVARSIISFLRDDVGIPHLALLPYSQPLITLARFFHFHPTPHRRSRDLLARWLWRGALTGLHRGDTMSTRRTLKVINGDEHTTVQFLLDTIDRGRLRASIPIDNFNFRYGMGKIQTLVLYSLGPQHLENGSMIQPDGTEDGGSLFPPQVVLERTIQRATLGNRILHPAVAGGVRNAILATRDQKRLASHAITEDAQAALERDDTEAFIQLRATTLQPIVDAFVARHARWDESDRPPLSALVVEDED